MSQRLTINNVVTFLRDSIPDPLSRTQEYIWVGYPRSPVISFPLISVTPVGGDRTPMSMGNTGNRFTINYQVDIFTNTGANATIAGSEKLAQVELINYLIDLVSNVFRDDNCTFRDTYNCIDVWITPIRILPYDEELDIYRGVSTLVVQVNDPKS